MGCSCRNLVFQPTTDFSGGDFFVRFFRVATPQRRLRRAGLHPLYSQQSMLTFEGDQFQGPKRGIRAKMMAAMGENLERNEFGSRRGLFRSRDVCIYIYCIYIIIHTYFFKREGKNSSTNGKWVVWVGDLGF